MYLLTCYWESKCLKRINGPVSKQQRFWHLADPQPKSFIFKMRARIGIPRKILFDCQVQRYTDMLGWNFCDYIVHFEKGFPFYYQRKRLH